MHLNAVFLRVALKNISACGRIQPVKQAFCKAIDKAVAAAKLLAHFFLAPNLIRGLAFLWNCNVGHKLPREPDK